MSAEQVTESWAVIERWLAKNTPQTYASLRPPADPAAVDAAQQTLGLTFPEDLLASLARHDGTDDGPDAFRLAPDNVRLLSVAEIVAAKQEATAAQATGDYLPLRWDAPESGRPWVPFAAEIAPCLLVLSCPDGRSSEAIGRHTLSHRLTNLHEQMTFGDLLVSVADRLGGVGPRRPGLHAVPVVFRRGLRWSSLAETHHPAPRSMLAMAAAEAEPDVPDHRLSRRPEFDPEVGWISEYDNCCLTFVHGISQDELFRRFDADPPSAELRAPTQALELQHRWTAGYRPVIRVGYAGDWVFAFEEYRAEGRRPERLRRLSAGTWTVAVRYAVGHLVCTVVADGVVISGYDNTRPDQRGGSDPDRFLTALRAAGLIPVDSTRNPDLDVPALFEVLRRELGIVFDGRMLRGALPAAPYWPMLPETPEDGTWHPRTELAIEAMLLHAPEPQLRAAAVGQARRLAAETGLYGYPEVADALDRVAGGERWRVDGDSPLGLRLHRILAEAELASRSQHDSRLAGRLGKAERRAWWIRKMAVPALIGVITRPPRDALPYLLSQRLGVQWRDEFVTDLGPVDVPEGAVEELIAERERTAAAQAAQPEPESGPFSEVARQRQQLRRQRRSGR